MAAPSYVLVGWLARWQAIQIHRAVLAGAEPFLTSPSSCAPAGDSRRSKGTKSFWPFGMMGFEPFALPSVRQQRET